MREAVFSPSRLNAPRVIPVPNASIADILKFTGAPDGCTVEVNGTPVRESEWHQVPSELDHVLIYAPVHGGGDKDPLRVVLTIAVVVASAAVPGALGITSGVAAGLAQGAAMTAGMFLVDALAPVRLPEGPGSQAGPADSPTYSIQGGRNDMRPFGSVPVVLGRHRITPPLAARPYTELGAETGDEYLRMLVVWGYAPLAVEDIRIGDTPIDDYADCEIEHSADNETGLFPGVVNQISVGTVLPEYNEESEETGAVLRTAPAGSDELSIDIIFPRGLVEFLDNGQRAERTVEVRAHYREVGESEWIEFDRTVDYDAGSITNDSETPVSGYLYADIEGNIVTGGPSRRNAYRIARYFGSPSDGDQDPTYTIVETYSHPEVTGLTLSGSGSSTISWTSGQAEFSGPGFVVTGKTTSAIRKGYSWRVDRDKEYEVELYRVTPESESDQIVDDVHWYVLRGIRNESPVKFPRELAMTAIRIRATEQLQGVIDNLNAVVTSVCEVWDGEEWGNPRPTNNPAALYRYVLMHPANARPRTSEQINEEALGAWYEFCETNGYAFNMVRDFSSSVWETLSDIAAAGRASPTITDGLWSVVIDEPGKPVINHITPRNSWGFTAEKAFYHRPHAFRIPFLNENEGYAQDERIVYDDGYNESNATLFEAIELRGITDPDLIWKFGRFHIAQARLRPETYTVFQDFEHLVCRRGDKVRVQHDVTLWGLGSGRIKSLVESNDEITGVILDDSVTMEEGKSYTVRFRTPDNSITRGVVTAAGETSEIEFADPIPSGISAGDLYMFGEAGVETAELIVKNIERQNDLVAKLTLVDEAPEIYNADTGEIPEFDSNITAPVDVTRVPPATPVIVNVESGLPALEFLSGATSPGIIVSVAAGEGTVRISRFRFRYRETGFVEWHYAETASTTVRISGVETGVTYQIQAQAVSIYGVESAWSDAVTETVIGENAEPPPGPVSFTATATAAGIRLEWSDPPDPTRRGYILSIGESYEGSTEIGRPGHSPFTYPLPISPGDYQFWAATLDRSGVVSDEPSTVVIEVNEPGTPEVSHQILGETVVLTWPSAQTTFPIAHYLVDGKQVNGRTYSERITWVGERDFKIVAVDVSGNQSDEATETVEVLAIPAPTNLTATGLTYAIRVALTYTRTSEFEAAELWASTTNDRANARRIAETGDTVVNVTGLPLTATRYFWSRVRNRYGEYSDWYPESATGGVQGQTSTDPTDYLDALTGAITLDQFEEDLAEEIGAIPQIESAIEAIQSTLSDIQALPEFDDGEAWEEGDIVKYEGALYRALQNMPTPPAPLPTDTDYWEKIGDYASLAEAVAGHAAILSTHETRIGDAEGDIEAAAGRLDLVEAGIENIEEGIESLATITYVDDAVANEEQARAAQYNALEAQYGVLAERGDNHIINGSFEHGMEPHVPSSLPNGGTWTIEESETAYHGNHVLQYDSDGQTGLARVVPNGAQGDRAGHLEVTPGERLRASFMTRLADGTANRVRIRIYTRGSDLSQVEASASLDGVVTPGAEWAPAVTEMVVPEGAVYAHAQIDVLHDENVGLHQFDFVRFERLDAGAYQAAADVLTAAQAYADSESAAAILATSLSATVTDEETGLAAAHAAINVTAQAVADLDDVVAASYSVVLNANGHITGFRSAIDEEGNSEFDILSDRFRIVNKDDEGNIAVPFVVGDINGNSAVGINGDLIVDGTILGRAIASDTTVTAGSGNNVGVLDGAHSTYRIYAGHANPANAPFRVTQTGAVTMTNATIQSSTGNERIEINPSGAQNRILWKDSSGTERIRIGVQTLSGGGAIEALATLGSTSFASLPLALMRNGSTGNSAPLMLANAYGARYLKPGPDNDLILGRYTGTFPGGGSWIETPVLTPNNYADHIYHNDVGQGSITVAANSAFVLVPGLWHIDSRPNNTLHVQVRTMASYADTPWSSIQSAAGALYSQVWQVVCSDGNVRVRNTANNDQDFYYTWYF